MSDLELACLWVETTSLIKSFFSVPASHYGRFYSFSSFSFSFSYFFSFFSQFLFWLQLTSPSPCILESPPSTLLAWDSTYSVGSQALFSFLFSFFSLLKIDHFFFLSFFLFLLQTPYKNTFKSPCSQPSRLTFNQSIKWERFSSFSFSSSSFFFFFNYWALCSCIKERNALARSFCYCNIRPRQRQWNTRPVPLSQWWEL